MKAAVLQWQQGALAGRNSSSAGFADECEVQATASHASHETVTLVDTTPRKVLAQMSDEQLMGSISVGERAALEELYGRYVKGCYGLAMKIVRDPSLAEEIVQDVFLKLWTRPAELCSRARQVLRLADDVGA